MTPSTPWLLAAVLALTLAAPVGAQEIGRGRGATGIHVDGVGQVTAAPDIARLRAGVVSEASEASAALAANSQAMERVLAALREAGVAKEDLQTESFDVSPRYRRSKVSSGEAPMIDGYVVSNRVRATVRDLDKLGAVLDTLVGEGANQIDSVRFDVAEPEPLLDEARKLAMADARRRATLLAAAEGVTVGRVLQIDETSSARPGPLPVMRQRAMAEASVPIAEGSLAFEARVRVRYAIDD